MKATKRKVVLIGTGMVGMSYIYAMINQGIASDYVLVDLNEESAEGNAWDIDDAKASLSRPFSSVRAGTYNDCENADLIVITAGRPQLDGETRLDMVAGNAKIMKQIATAIKNSGFSGVTLIASNPVDVMTQIYQEVTKFDEKTVLGSGTTLDSARYTRLIGKDLGIHPQSIHAYIIGEHGDSSVPTISAGMIGLAPITTYVSPEKLEKYWEKSWQMAYEIIKRKRATYFGIGASLAKLSRIILADLNEIVPISVKLNGEYNNDDVYIGVPAILGAGGWVKVIEVPLSEKEQERFDKSAAILKKAIAVGREAIK